MERNNQKLVTYGAILVALLLMIGLGLTSVSKNKKSKKLLTAEKQVSEKLLSEKLSSEKEVARLKADFSSLKQKSDANQQLLDETNKKIADAEKRLNSLSSENRTLRANKKELEDLKKVKADLEQESSRLKSEYDRLVAQNKDLQNLLNAAEKKYIALLQQNEQKIDSDNFLITATRGKKAEKIVIRASRAKKLNMAFEVPQNLTGSLAFKLTTPSGEIVNPDDKSLSWVINENSGNLTASLSAVTGEFEQSRQVVLNYMPKNRLSKGEYKIQILSGEKSIGNCRIVLK